jgi:starvation-inducible DNA-binding protein
MNRIGLNQQQAEELINHLNDLLANYQLYYMNVRSFHWNIKGNKFFELHLKFEELYNDLLLKVDEIAERVLTLGGTPVHAYSDYLKCAQIKEVKDVCDANGAITSILNSFEILLIKQREILTISAKTSDEGTNALMSDYISKQEKLVWMYSAFMNK